jgi:regulator of protease activity HflC (stomatin/prohibitin superfamily)
LVGSIIVGLDFCVLFGEKMDCCCFGYIREMDAGIVENFGKFSRVLPAGFYWLNCPCEVLTKTISLRVQYLECVCDTKTKDNVFVHVVVAVLFKVVEEKVPSAVYKLSDPVSQIRSYIYDVVRSSVPRLDIDAAFASKDDVANAVKNQLSVLMADYGYEIIAALVIDLDPNPHIKAAMNEINASQRLREAAAEKAEAEKILQVKAAEAEADSKYLSGLGVARQRRAIVDGLRETVTGFSSDVPGASPKDVMDLLLVTQYFDMIRDVGGKKAQSSTLFLPHGPHSVDRLRDDIKNSFRMNSK